MLFRSRRGTPATLASLGTRLGFTVAVVPPYAVDGLPVRSASIRAAIASGDLTQARHLLGRPMAVTGDRDDSTVGFPIPVALPPDGRYAATIEPAWTEDGRQAPPRQTIGVVAGQRVGTGRAASTEGPRVRLTLGRRLPEDGNPAILRRSQK